MRRCRWHGRGKFVIATALCMTLALWSESHAPLQWRQLTTGVLIEVGELPTTEADAYTLKIPLP